MPQMSPLNWPILFMYTLMIFIMILILTYYCHSPPSTNIPPMKSMCMKKYNWKW